MKNDNLKNQYRVNEQIRAKEVRIVGDDVESVVIPLHKALALAEEKELDLVEISPTANPPVCRLIECILAHGFMNVSTYFGLKFAYVDLKTR